MNILFLSPASGADYMCDMLYHGLRSIPGCRVTDVNPLGYMLRGADVSKLRGGGYTLYGLLEPDETVRRDRIRERIARREFDLVVYGSIQRSSQYLSDVLKAYAPHEIAFIDGEDHQIVLRALVECGVYFKRELPGYGGVHDGDWIKPINFALPEEKIGTVPMEKSREMAFIDPRDRSTYVYGTEAEYFADYGRSRFGVTIKKAGWDCLRHYEILANGCVPYFMDLMLCPPGTMTELPKALLLSVNADILEHGLQYFKSAQGQAQWEKWNIELQRVLRERLTTRCVAQSVIRRCAAMQDVPSHRTRWAKRRSATAVAAIRWLSPSGESAWRRSLLNSAYVKLAREDQPAR